MSMYRFEIIEIYVNFHGQHGEKKSSAEQKIDSSEPYELFFYVFFFAD